MTKASLMAIGTALPPHRLSQEKIAELISQGFHLNSAEKRLLKSVYKATGIEFRSSVLDDCARSPGEFAFFPNEAGAPFPTTAARMRLYKENALTLALSAVKSCFEKLGHIDKKTITHLITVSCTGMYAPGLDIELVQHLKLLPGTQRTTVNFMGCYGAFNGLKLAEAACRADPKAKALVVCVELCTLHFQRKMNLDNLISNAIFADGAAAALVQAEPVSERQNLRFERFYCDLLPQTSQEMAWEIADSGFDIVLSSYVPEAIHSGIADFLERLLKQTHLKKSDLDFFAIHPGGIKILEACEKALNLHPEQNKHAYQVLRDCGNMSSATILFVLQALWADLKQDDKGKHIFCCAFGPGLTLEAMILNVTY